MRHNHIMILSILLIFGTMFSVKLTNSFRSVDEKKIWFLSHLKGLADSGRIDEPDFVGDYLGGKFTSDENKAVADPAECATGRFGIVSNSQIKVIPDRNFWYKPHNNKRLDFYLGSETVQPAPPPEISYIINEVYFCNPVSAFVAHQKDTVLDFLNLRQFMCITTDDVRAYFPDIERVQSVHSPGSYAYLGNINDDETTRLAFIFPWKGDGDCLTRADIGKTRQGSLKQQRAWVKLELCRIEKAKTLCPLMKGQTFPYGLENAVIGRADDECGSLQSFMDREPNSNEKPPYLDPLTSTYAASCGQIRK